MESLAVRNLPRTRASARRALLVNRRQEQAGDGLLAVKMLVVADVIIAQAAERRDLVKRIALRQAAEKALRIGETHVEQSAAFEVVLVAQICQYMWSGTAS